MQLYKDYTPTPFDYKGAFLRDQRHWRVAPVCQTRDSGPLDQSNYAAALAAIEEVDPEGEHHEEHRFGHWGPGWFEIIIVRPCTPAAIVAKQLELALQDYPLLDEEDHSAREWELTLEGIPLYIEGQLIDDLPEDWVSQLHSEMDYCEVYEDGSLGFPQDQDPTTLAEAKGWLEPEE